MSSQLKWPTYNWAKKIKIIDFKSQSAYNKKSEQQQQVITSETTNYSGRNKFFLNKQKKVVIANTQVTYNGFNLCMLSEVMWVFTNEGDSFSQCGKIKVQLETAVFKPFYYKLHYKILEYKHDCRL